MDMVKKIAMIFAMIVTFFDSSAVRPAGVRGLNLEDIRRELDARVEKYERERDVAAKQEMLDYLEYLCDKVVGRDGRGEIVFEPFNERFEGQPFAVSTWLLALYARKADINEDIFDRVIVQPRMRLNPRVENDERNVQAIIEQLNLN